MPEGEESMMKKRMRAGNPFLGFFLCPVLTLLLTELYTHNPLTDIKPAPWLLNFLLYWLTAALLLMVTGRLRLALRIHTLFFLLAGLANYYVIAFRASPILPWDIYSAATAASVADNFSYALPGRIWLVLLGYAVLLALEQAFPWKIEKKNVRLAGALTVMIALAGFASLLHQESVIAKLRLYDKMFTPGAVQRRNGCAVAFTMEMKYLITQKPEGYDVQECRALLAPYGNGGAESAQERSGRLPNIIVIMDEAFADLSYVGEFTCNQDYMPFLHSLQGAENTISGKLHVSVLGGNTANTEFEFLTGNTMAFLPEGSVPYQQYVRGDLFSLAARLKEEGYQSVAMHPYHASGWSRNKVYPWLGFDEMRFLEAYEDAEYVRKYVSDASDFARIIEEYEQRDKEKPLFLFNVTMQNHGGYDQEADNFTPEIEAEGIPSQAVSNYLSLVCLTDRALQDLIAYFAQEEEETMIVFFGDHQPNNTIASPIWRAGGISLSELSREQELSRYQVPFVVWANFDIEEKKGVETSANFLALEVLRQAGIALDGYYGYLAKLQESYPVITAKQVKAADGRVLTREEEEAAQELLTYQKLQYYQLFN